jgi:ribosome biogenesis GTPase
LNTEQKSELNHLVNLLSNKERKDLQKRAAGRRAEAQQTRKPEARWSIEQWMLHLLQKPAAAEGPVGTVEWVGRAACRVRFEGASHECGLTKELVAEQQTVLAPGDRVRLELRDAHSPIVVEVLPRRTELVRLDPHMPGRRRAIVANVDVVVVVVSLVSPPLHPRLVDRYLAAIGQGGAQAVVAVNKVDLADSQEELREELAKLGPIAGLGVPVVPVSVAEGTGVVELRGLLAGRTCAFVGHSGVGKSSLLNALFGVEAVTGDVSGASGRGRHTTTASQLHEGEDGTVLIDTPGVREFAVAFESLEDVQAAFPEFAEEGRCSFRGCRHAKEPGCAVQVAVREGRISRARYGSYLRLAQEFLPEDDDEEDPAGYEGGAFTCRNCGAAIPSAGAGTQHRNHCSICLHSVHVDHVPGDRAGCCGGVMEPVAVWVRKGGEWAVIHRCRDCGHLSSNRIAADDNGALLLSLAVRPLSQPPFPLDRIAIA